MTKRIKPKWQLEKEQSKKSKRGTFDSLNDYVGYWANQFQEAFSKLGKAFQWGYDKKKSKDAVGILTANTTTLFENRTDEIRRKKRPAIEKTRRVRKKNKRGLVN